MDIVALIVFIGVQILFIPLAIVGYILIFYKQVYVSKKLGTSFAAAKVITVRWTMDVFGLRADTASVKLIQVLPNNSMLGLWLVLLPLYLRYKIGGKNYGYPVITEPGKEGMSSAIYNRTLYFDKIINQAKGAVEQFVVMGAGFDTRCYGDLKNSDLGLFELDQAKMQQTKREYLKRVGIDTSHVTFVTVDFTTEHWYEKLEAAGYDPNKKSFFLWEGVTLYLSEIDVRNILRELEEHAVPGSIIAADFYSHSLLTGQLHPRVKAQLEALKIANEEPGFGLDFSADYENALKTFLESENTNVGEAYFMGYKTKKGTFMVVTEINL